MKAIVFGASGMVGQSVLRECVLDMGVESVVAVGRSPLGIVNPKFREIVHADFLDFTHIEKQLKGFDVCFYCLGIASAGLREAEYKRVTCDFTLAAAKTLLRVNPKIVFVFISGMGADTSEKGRIMWARIKGKTENELFKMKSRSVYVIRPAFIQPLDGIQSRTGLYRWLYRVFRPFMPLIKLFAPKSVITTRALGRLMIRIAREGSPKKLFESADLVAMAKSGNIL
jgi:uncharacterized protein YbjT (DUF2867 family)